MIGGQAEGLDGEGGQENIFLDLQVLNEQPDRQRILGRRVLREAGGSAPQVPLH